MTGVPHRCLFTAYRLLDLTPAHAAIRLWPEYPPSPDSQASHYLRPYWGPKRPFVIQALGGPKILGQVTGELLGFISLPNSSCRRRRLGAKPSDIHGRDRPKQLQPKRRQGRQSDLVTIDAKSCINPKSDTSNPDTDEVAIGRNTNRFGEDRN